MTRGVRRPPPPGLIPVTDASPGACPFTPDPEWWADWDGTLALVGGVWVLVMPADRSRP